MAAYNGFPHNLLPKIKPEKLGDSVTPAERAQQEQVQILESSNNFKEVTYN